RLPTAESAPWARIFAPTPRGGKQSSKCSDTMSRMAFRAVRSSRPLAAVSALWVLIGCLACGPRPAEFRVVGLEEAQRAVEQERLSVVEAVGGEAAQSAVPTVPVDSGVLIVGLDARAARMRAASFARAGNHPVLVFIPRDADERGRFYAAATQRQEVRRGKDS